MTFAHALQSQPAQIYCHVISPHMPSSFRDSWLHGWAKSNDFFPSRVVRSRLAPDRPVHVDVVQLQPILRLPGPLVPSTRPTSTLHSMLSYGSLITACEISCDSVAHSLLDRLLHLLISRQSCLWNSQQLPSARGVESLDASLLYAFFIVSMLHNHMLPLAVTNAVISRIGL